MLASQMGRALAGLPALVAAVVLALSPSGAQAQQRPPRSAPTPQASQWALSPPAQERALQRANETWVQNFEVTEQWSGPGTDAKFYGWLRQFSYLRLERAEGDYLLVFNPRTNGRAYVRSSAVGPSGPPPREYLEPVRVLTELNLPGRLLGAANIYGEPADDYGVWLRTDGHNTPVIVEAQVVGDGGSWYRLEGGEFVPGNQVRLPAPPVTHYSGKWIDADLRDPTLVTAYQGDRPVASALAIRGVATWETPVGTYHIFRRVENETMSSEGFGIPRNAPGGYYVKNVLFTQYFTGNGAALHYNYWSGNFGYPGSHGCLGLSYDDSHWFWNWVDIGTPIVLHY